MSEEQDLVPRIRVVVEITPPPEVIGIAQANELVNNEIQNFEKWFLGRQRFTNSRLPAEQRTMSPLIQAERSAITAYLHYVYTTRNAEVKKEV